MLSSSWSQIWVRNCTLLCFYSFFNDFQLGRALSLRRCLFRCFCLWWWFNLTRSLCFLFHCSRWFEMSIWFLFEVWGIVFIQYYHCLVSVIFLLSCKLLFVFLLGHYLLIVDIKEVLSLGFPSITDSVAVKLTCLLTIHCRIASSNPVTE